jgi:hypothetical protein
LPNLRAALSRLEKLRPDRFADIDQATRPDVRAVLAEIISRSQYFLKELDDETDH